MNISEQQFEHLGKYLRSKRLKAGLSQEKVALALGYSERHFLSRIENDRASLPWEKIPDLAALYGIQAWELAEAVISEQTRLTRERIQRIIEKSSPSAAEPNLHNRYNIKDLLHSP